jgi:methionyl-tRNA formyltransferase
MGGAGTAKIQLGGQSYHVMNLEFADDHHATVTAGQILSHRDDKVMIQAGDGALQLTIQPLEASE